MRTPANPRASLVAAMIAGAAMLPAACTLGPNYARPGVEAPAAYKEAQGWKPAQPRDNEPRGNWWSVFEMRVTFGPSGLAWARGRIVLRAAFIR